VLGARVLAAADDTVAVWRLARDIPAGTAVSGADLQLTRVHFDDPAVAGQYILADHSLGPGSRATRDLMAGEILASSALTSAAAPATRQLPLGVDAVHAPADLRVGDHVQVWAVPSAAPGSGTRPPAPSLVLSDVTVLSPGGTVVGVSAERQVLVGLRPRTDVGAVLRRITGSAVVLIRLAG
jgi:SAF domain